ncbi:HAMP domain-containing sensor histidine kinase [Flavobacterium sp. DG1-102-2]|uniref:sensor histidine kinase n=1 Tax=Flavobacterium sp. DG1-102-2 TaxID=3081663 RepID=UPI002949DEEF|nr:HAMP domain-containing sensor histidine kinase [Flavobacterium sp. DG1-102-2]MDV6169336.1 HAMP domain-containing sensor histidine kinase [Flavobacterium sp. DG1-102-2]
MRFTDNRNITRWVIIAASFFIVISILWNTYSFFNIFKEDERKKVDLLVQSYQMINDTGGNFDVELPFRIVSNNTTIPVIMTNSRDSIVDFKNLPNAVETDPVRKQSYLQELKQAGSFVVLRIGQKDNPKLYYGSSLLLNNLKYYPITLVIIVILFATIVFIFYRASRMATQNRLWAGMAKETAHQIGTPLSSLLGWIEIMKADNVDETTVEEIEKDVHRLQIIAERFSKVGSEPVLQELDIVAETEKSFEYLRSRASRQVEFFFMSPNHPVPVMLNPELHSWTIENLVKNAIDAMKGKGRLDLIISENETFIKIKVSDTGKGIPKSQFRKIFEPGFTTKKRGWGLGLSLTKRIVEEYHKGKIKVLSSEVGRGTTMQASYKKQVKQ